MIRLKASLKGIPFTLEINGKEVIYTDYAGKKTQWFPPNSKAVLASIDKEEYAQWSAANNEDEILRLIKFDLIKNSCIIIEEKNEKKEKNDKEKSI